jgi:hypothetical protein
MLDGLEVISADAILAYVEHDGFSVVFRIGWERSQSKCPPGDACRKNQGPRAGARPSAPIVAGTAH